MALEPGAMMKLRRELLLLRDGTAQETEIRTMTFHSADPMIMLYNLVE